MLPATSTTRAANLKTCIVTPKGKNLEGLPTIVIVACLEALGSTNGTKRNETAANGPIDETVFFYPSSPLGRV